MEIPTLTQKEYEELIDAASLVDVPVASVMLGASHELVALVAQRLFLSAQGGLKDVDDVATMFTTGLPEVFLGSLVSFTARFNSGCSMRVCLTHFEEPFDMKSTLRFQTLCGQIVTGTARAVLAINLSQGAPYSNGVWPYAAPFTIEEFDLPGTVLCFSLRDCDPGGPYHETLKHLFEHDPAVIEDRRLALELAKAKTKMKRSEKMKKDVERRLAAERQSSYDDGFAYGFAQGKEETVVHLEVGGMIDEAAAMAFLSLEKDAYEELRKKYAKRTQA